MVEQGLGRGGGGADWGGAWTKHRPGRESGRGRRFAGAVGPVGDGMSAADMACTGDQPLGGASRPYGAVASMGGGDGL